MRLLRLRVSDFGAVAQADIEFGPGLNVLYGPNEIGKSTLADAIRCALLLQHTSTFAEHYRPWRGGEPVVEMTFETEAQRIWRVRKQFGRIGSSVLEESRNGVDFDEAAKGRSVDARVREILQWGIPDPGGIGTGRGIPTSFLATALLSTQSAVTAVLENSLQGDPAPSGRDRIAAALQAVAQDPLFVSLLRTTQARRDEAFTERGARKTARDSPFRLAADRLREVRIEKERLERVVEESASVEQQLRDLTERRDRGEEAVAFAADRLKVTERLAAEAAELTAAAEQVRLASIEVDRIQTLCSDLAEAERNVAKLASRKAEAEEAIRLAQTRKREADATLHAAQEPVRPAGVSAEANAEVARQKLELRRAAADRAFAEAQQRIDAISAARTLVDQATSAASVHRAQQAEVERTGTSLAEARANLDVCDRQRQRLAVLERGLEAVTADEQVADARAALDNAAAATARLDAALAERDTVRTRRDALIVPTAEAVTAMRRLATELARARGALDVGLLVTVRPRRALDIRIQQDGGPPQPAPPEESVEVEAHTQVEIDIAGVVAVHVTGGRRAAQRHAQALEERWSREVLPHLVAAKVTDLDALDGRIGEARELESDIQRRDAEIASLREQIASVSGSAEMLRTASERQRAAHAALGDVALDSLLDPLRELGSNPTAALRAQRDQVTRALDAARERVNRENTAHVVAEERSRNLRAALDEAIAARDTALQSFPEGLAPALAQAQAALGAATEERQKVALDLASLQSSMAAEQARIDAALRAAREAAEAAQRQLEMAQDELAKAIAEHAAQVGRVEELRRQRDAEDLPAAEQRLRSATERQAELPVPEQLVGEAEVTAAREALRLAEAELSVVGRDIDKAHGALEQVGGAVARERLRDVREAFDLAQLQEREIETDYEAWKLLLEQLKEADVAQGSHLGQALAPAIQSRFEALTASRYDSVRLNAQLGTEGVLVGGDIKPVARISVGTREQLSTLYRLSLAEYLSTTVVLDDQLVQSDGARMDWFRALLLEKARSFQIVVLTCRPDDYLSPAALAPPGPSFRHDTESGFVRSIDLARAAHLR